MPMSTWTLNSFLDTSRETTAQRAERDTALSIPSWILLTSVLMTLIGFTRLSIPSWILHINAPEIDAFIEYSQFLPGYFGVPEEEEAEIIGTLNSFLDTSVVRIEKQKPFNYSLNSFLDTSSKPAGLFTVTVVVSQFLPGYFLDNC